MADLALVDPAEDVVLPLPPGADDVQASTLAVAARTAVAALDAIEVRAGETVLIGGAAGGVGDFAVQLARIAGARVVAVASKSAFELLESLGAEPVQRGDGLVERVRAASGDQVTAAVDLHGDEVASAAVELGVSPTRIATIAAPGAAGRFRAAGAFDVPPEVLGRVAVLLADGRLTVPIAARFPLERVRDAVALQASRSAHGKAVITV